MSFTKSGAFGYAGGGKGGAIVDLWAASRFGVYPPAENQAPPSGSPDAGPVTTSGSAGSPGAYFLSGIPVVQDYCIRFQYGGNTYWTECPAGSLGGQSVAGGGLDVVNTVFSLNAYTLAITDANTAQQCLSTVQVEITVPRFVNVAFPVGTVITFTQQGAGKVSLAAPGVTILTSVAGGFVTRTTGTRAEGSTIGILNTATDAWTLAGDAG
jgi:hypothetical protein